MAETLIELLEKELKKNNVWLKSPSDKEAVLNELHHAITIPKHEKKISPYGVIFSDEIEVEDHKIIPLTDLETARSLADGERSFVLYKSSNPVGLLVLSFRIIGENQLVELQKTYKGLVIQRSTSAVVKIIQKSEIFIQEHRVWQSKPSVDSVLDKIYRCVPEINRDILISILNFAFHLLSPDNIGATLIWCLEDLSSDDIEKMKPRRDLTGFNIKMTDPDMLDLLRHILSQIDGATLINSEGVVTGTEAHLNYSERSRDIISQTKGTRHTSAKRFSYDQSKIIAFTISEDGPVTVFSDGANIADLDIFSAFRAAFEIERDTPEAATTSGSSIIQCRNCHKYVQVEELIIYGWKSDESVDCPICGSEIYRARCHHLAANVVKKM